MESPHDFGRGEESIRARIRPVVPEMILATYVVAENQLLIP
jgi:hypothetical protein